MSEVGVDGPIGSFFESAPEFALNEASAPRWEVIGEVQYLQTGRQALAAVAAQLSREGRDTLLIPEYLCDSMIVGFPADRWSLRTYAVSLDFEIVADDLLRVASESESARTAAMTIAFFGKEPTSAHVEAVQTLQTRGVRVVEDETHRVLGDLEPLGDFGVASLRKVLPVADGAYVRGLSADLAVIERPHRGWEAMDLKRLGELARARAVFAEASVLLDDDRVTPARVSDRTIDAIRTLDFEAMRVQRRINSAALIDALVHVDRVRVVSKAETPSHVVIEVGAPKRIQDALAAHGIFCPIHWPQPARLAGGEWRTGLLSLPVDHRYTAADMRRIGAALAGVLS